MGSEMCIRDREDTIFVRFKILDNSLIEEDQYEKLTRELVRSESQVGPALVCSGSQVSPEPVNTSICCVAGAGPNRYLQHFDVFDLPLLSPDLFSCGRSYDHGTNQERFLWIWRTRGYFFYFSSPTGRKDTVR